MLKIARDVFAAYLNGEPACHGLLSLGRLVILHAKLISTSDFSAKVEVKQPTSYTGETNVLYPEVSSNAYL